MSVNTLVNNELQRVAGSDSGNHVDYNMQVSTMPEASAQYANLIFQYVGTTDENYTNGYFYKCFVNEETTPTSYTWKVLKLNSLPITSYKELQEYWGLGGGGDANIEPLTIGTNGIYQATTGVDGYAPISVDVYNKYDVLYFSNSVSSSVQGFAKNIISEEYNDIWRVGEYSYSAGSGNHTSLWCSRYPIDTIFPFVSGRLFGCNGSDNYSWVTFNSTGDYASNHLINYDSPYMYIGLKNKDMIQDVLWQSTESTTPNTITLSESIFDYDEVCFFMIKSDGATSATWYLTSELEIGDIIRGYDDTDQSTYAIASNTTMTISTEGTYRLYTVYGIKDNSMEKTTLYTNPDGTMPQTIYFSESYTNFDELVIEGHVSGGIVCEQRYPVMIFGRRSHVPADDRIQISTKDVSSWFTILSEMSMSVDDNRVIVDKVIGIKRPVIGDMPEIQTNVRQINPFPSGETTITPYHSNGVTVNSSGINSDGTAALNISEWSNGYEGMVIELNVTADHIYAVEFDYQNINTDYMTGFPIGWLLENGAHTSYEDTSHWYSNLSYTDTLKHHIKESIVATGNKIYMNFNLCGYSDYQTNTIEITNLKVYEITIPEE